MPEPTARTESPEPAPPIEGLASDPPWLLLMLLWIPAFAVVAWGMMLVFGSKPWEFRSGAPAPVSPTEPLEPVGVRSEPPAGSDAPRADSDASGTRP